MQERPSPKARLAQVSTVVAPVDLDNNGNLDILVLGKNRDRIELLLGDETGKAQQPSALGLADLDHKWESRPGGGKPRQQVGDGQAEFVSGVGRLLLNRSANGRLNNEVHQHQSKKTEACAPFKSLSKF